MVAKNRSDCCVDRLDDQYFIEKHSSRLMVKRGQVAGDFEQINEYQLYWYNSNTPFPWHWRDRCLPAGKDSPIR